MSDIATNNLNGYLARKDGIGQKFTSTKLSLGK